jgi:hypothetical protein
MVAAQNLEVGPTESFDGIERLIAHLKRLDLFDALPELRLNLVTGQLFHVVLPLGPILLLGKCIPLRPAIPHFVGTEFVWPTNRFNIAHPRPVGVRVKVRADQLVRAYVLHLRLHSVGHRPPLPF